MSEHAKGATKSLRRTIRKIKLFLDDKKSIDDGGSGYRGRLHRLISELSIRSYRRGFRQGCRQAYEHYQQHGTFPAEIICSKRPWQFNGERIENLRWPK